MEEKQRKSGRKSEYWMIIPLDRAEVVRRLKNVTILRGEWVSFQNREKYLFYGKVEDRKFVLYINRTHAWVTKDSFLPRGVSGTIKEGARGRSIVSFRVKKQQDGLFMILAVLLMVSSVPPVEAVDAFGVVWGLVFGGIFILERWYYRYTERYVVEWLAELWEAEEVI